MLYKICYPNHLQPFVRSGSSGTFKRCGTKSGKNRIVFSNFVVLECCLVYVCLCFRDFCRGRGRADRADSASRAGSADGGTADDRGHNLP